MTRVKWSEFQDRKTSVAEYLSAIALICPAGLSKTDGPWVAGGAPRRAITNKEESDFDFFFPSEDALAAFVSRLKESGFEVSSDGKMNTTLFGKIGEEKQRSVKVQAIKIYAPTVEEVLSSFDFTICMFGDDGTGELVMHDMAIFDLLNKRLVVNRISYAASSVRRMLKYAKQGYTLCDGAITALLEAVGTDPSIIRSEVKYVD